MGTRQGGGCEGSLESGSVWEHGTCDNVGPRIGGKWGPRLGSWGAGPGLEAGPIHEAGSEVRRILSVERWEVRIGPGNTMSWTMRSVLRRGMAGLLLVPVWRAQRSAGDGRPGERGRAHPAIPGDQKLPPMGYGRATIPPKTAKNRVLLAKSLEINDLCSIWGKIAKNLDLEEVEVENRRKFNGGRGLLKCS